MLVSKSLEYSVLSLHDILQWRANMLISVLSMLERFCTVSVALLDPTFNLVLRVDDDLEFFSAAHSRNTDTMAHSTLSACTSADWPRKRCVETWTDNVGVGQEPASNESVGSGAFCVRCEECSMYLLRVSGPTLCSDCED